MIIQSDQNLIGSNLLATLKESFMYLINEHGMVEANEFARQSCYATSSFFE